MKINERIVARGLIGLLLALQSLFMPVVANADITADDFEECVWRGKIRLVPKDCAAFRKTPERVVSQLNGLPGESDDDKMMEMVLRACKERRYRGGVVGEHMGVVQYCSALDGFFPKRIRVVRSERDEVWIYNKGFRLLYVDAKTGLIRQVASNQ